ncbi:MAG: DUF4363 family protein [Clostridia bacterium]|nr:DUF4363 family protein [Clostridia bacterium]
MKAFIISIISSSLLVLMVIFNGIYIGNVTRRLDTMANDLKIDSKDEIDELESYWKKNESIICFSVSHKDVDNVNTAIEVLKGKYESGDMSGFYEYKSLLILYIEEIRDKERFHIHNIL